MDSYSSAPSKRQPSSKEVMDRVRAELELAYAKDFFEKARDKCFAKCVTKPSSSLTGSESSCVSRCVDRFIEAATLMEEHVDQYLNNKRGATNHMLRSTYALV